MIPIRLSICVPVYNFARWLTPTVESIARQAPPDVEILIVDGASTDETPEIALGLEGRFPGVHYHRLDRRGGIDRDIARSVELARGEYCWIFGGDDIMRDGAVSAALAEIQDGHDVYLVEAMLCDIAMRPSERLGMLDLRESRVFRLDAPGDRRTFFERARNTAAFFSYCSAVIFSRSRWLSVGVDERFMRSCFGIAARIFAMLGAPLSVKYVPRLFLDKRGENDSFTTHGIVRRYALSIDGYHALGDFYFGHQSHEAFHIRRVLRLEMPWIVWFHVKQQAVLGGPGEIPIFLRILRMQFSDPSPANWAAYLACRVFPVSAVEPTRRVVARLRALTGRAGLPPPTPGGDRA